MKKLLVSGLALGALVGAAFADPDYRQVISIPSGVTAVTQACFSAMSVSAQTGLRLDSYAVGVNASITNLTIAVRIIGASYTNDIAAVSAAAGTAKTAAAITTKQVVGRADYFVVTTAGATNAIDTQVYIGMMP